MLATGVPVAAVVVDTGPGPAGRLGEPNARSSPAWPPGPWAHGDDSPYPAMGRGKVRRRGERTVIVVPPAALGRGVTRRHAATGAAERPRPEAACPLAAWRTVGVRAAIVLAEGAILAAEGGATLGDVAVAAEGRTGLGGEAGAEAGVRLGRADALVRRRAAEPLVRPPPALADARAARSIPCPAAASAVRRTGRGGFLEPKKSAGNTERGPQQGAQRATPGAGGAEGANERIKAPGVHRRGPPNELTGGIAAECFGNATGPTGRIGARPGRGSTRRQG